MNLTEMIKTSGASSSGSLYDVIELIVDRGLVIDVFVRVALVGIEVLTIDARIVVASVDTYLRFAEACGRIGLGGSAPVALPGIVGQIGGGPLSLDHGMAKRRES